jgi:hypothetical protein
MNAKRVKSLVLCFLTAAMLLSCTACGGSPSKNDAAESTGEESSGTRPEQFSQDEYVLYQNVFYQDYGKEVDGTEFEKKGIFASVYDAYNNRDRYYVWGYYDQTRCCDWQWEFVPAEGETLPPTGSLVTVTGTFVSDANALDGYWIKDAQIKTETAFSGQSAELDMLSMSCTLERVQMYNIMNLPDSFVNKEFLAYGRIASVNTLEDPYYDDSWEIGFTWDGELPAIGTLVAVSGTTKDGTLIVSSLNKM